MTGQSQIAQPFRHTKSPAPTDQSHLDTFCVYASPCQPLLAASKEKLINGKFPEVVIFLNDLLLALHPDRRGHGGGWCAECFVLVPLSCLTHTHLSWPLQRVPSPAFCCHPGLNKGFPIPPTPFPEEKQGWFSGPLQKDLSRNLPAPVNARAPSPTPAN